MLPIYNDIDKLNYFTGPSFSFDDFKDSENVSDVINDILINVLKIESTYVIQEINAFMKKYQLDTTNIGDFIRNPRLNDFREFPKCTSAKYCLCYYITHLMYKLRIDSILDQATRSDFMENFDYDYIVLCIGSSDVRDKDNQGNRWQTIPLYARDLAIKNKKVLIVNIDPALNLNPLETPVNYNNNLKIINFRVSVEDINEVLNQLLTPAILNKKEIILHSFTCIINTAFECSVIAKWFDNLTVSQKQQLTVISGYFDSFRVNFLFCGDLKQSSENIHKQYQDLARKTLSNQHEKYDDLCASDNYSYTNISTELNNIFSAIGWITLPKNNQLNFAVLDLNKQSRSTNLQKDQDTTQEAIEASSSKDITSSSNLFFSNRLQQEENDAILAKLLQEEVDEMLASDEALANILQQEEYDNQQELSQVHFML